MLKLTANIGCSECLQPAYVTNVNQGHQNVVAPGQCLNVRRKHTLQPIAAPLCAVRYYVNYDVISPGSRRL